MSSPWPDVPAGSLFGLDNLPYGSFRLSGDQQSRVGVAVGDRVLDLGATALALEHPRAHLFADGDLDRLLAAGPAVWREVRTALSGWLGDGGLRPRLAASSYALDDVELRLPFSVADYVDFYSSEHHARNVGSILRPGADPLPQNWKHLPAGYHGRAGTVVPSGTPVARPWGQRRTAAGEVVLGPSTRLDLEAEVGFVVGAPPPPGRPVPLADLPQHVFGVCLVNDWSARDLQAWEYVPLGPFLGKSFATSVSPWVVPLDALQHAWVAPPRREPRPLPYLDDTGCPDGGLDIALEVRLNGHVVSRPPFSTMYWTAAQQLAHLTVNGARLRTGDLFASGTVSGPGHDERGSLLELSEGGARPLTLPDGSVRSFLEDGDEVVITATAPGPRGSRLGLGEVRGTVTAAAARLEPAADDGQR